MTRYKPLEDESAADHDITLVKDRCLPGCDVSLWRIKHDMNSAIV
jgi:hypothetical protein